MAVQAANATSFARWKTGVRTSAGAGVHNAMNQVNMTVHTVLLDYGPAARLKLDGLVKVLQGEGYRVVPAIYGFTHPLAHGVVGQVTVNTPGYIPVARALPGGVYLTHHVTVHTHLRVVG
jgi:hypothetical protein